MHRHVSLLVLLPRRNFSCVHYCIGAIIDAAIESAEITISGINTAIVADGSVPGNITHTSRVHMTAPSPISGRGAQPDLHVGHPTGKSMT